MKIGKYQFDSREAAQTKIDALGTSNRRGWKRISNSQTHNRTFRKYCFRTSGNWRRWRSRNRSSTI